MEHSTKGRKREETQDAPCLRRHPADSAEVSTHPLLQLQQQSGNQALQDLLKTGAVRAKLAMSQHDGPEEREAERISDQVMRAPESQSDDFEERLQMKRAGSGSAGREEASVPAIVSEILRSPGHPLDSAARAFFEPRFGRDFSDVRIHIDREAAESARSIHANAYTAGSDIIFASGQYSPATASGRALLAHELTHVVQRRSGSSNTIFRYKRRSNNRPRSAA